MPIIGLNIGKRSFRAVELDFKKDKIILNNFGNYSNPKISMDPSSDDDLKLISQSLEQFFSEVGFSSSDVVTSINETNVFMRIIKLPVMNDKELKSSIKFESEQYIPLPLDQVNVSYQKLEQDFSDKGKMSVQIVAARKDIVDKYVEILRKAKLTPKAIEPETIALGRVLGDTKESPSGTMILEMGYSNSLIVVCYGGFVRFTRAIPIGGDILTKTIMQTLSLDRDQAEEYKKVYGLDDFQGEGKVDNLILEVQRAAVFFTNHNPSASIKRVVLSGGTALMPNLLSYVANKLDLEVMLANPLNNIEISPKLEKQKQTIIDEAPLYSSVIGLALRKI
jgi:type IV pilus assembly protein PilM